MFIHFFLDSRVDVTSRIINGKETSISKRPFQVQLNDCNNYFVLKSCGFCSGSIIAPDWVLTAKHCVTKSTGLLSSLTAKLEVRAGSHDRNKGGEVRSVSKDHIILHDTAGKN